MTSTKPVGSVGVSRPLSGEIEEVVTVERVDSARSEAID
jgi:hypothetical protein